MNLFRVSSVALVILASIGAASADTIQNSRGTFIQDGNGVWHQYARVRPGVIAAFPQGNYDRYGYRPMPPLDLAKGDIN